MRFVLGSALFLVLTFFGGVLVCLQTWVINVRLSVHCAQCGPTHVAPPRPCSALPKLPPFSDFAWPHKMPPHLFQHNTCLFVFLVCPQGTAPQITSTSYRESQSDFGRVQSTLHYYRSKERPGLYACSMYECMCVLCNRQTHQTTQLHTISHDSIIVQYVD